MNKEVQEILTLWHQLFEEQSKHYSEYESSDVEYFVGCMLYNHFDFKYAVDTMKTIDLSYDFLIAVEENYDEVKSKIDSITLDDEAQKIEFLMAFLAQAKAKYTQDECYLINRLSYHVDAIKQRFDSDTQTQGVSFEAPPAKSRNPLSGM